MPSVLKFIAKQQVFPHCTPTHMTDSMTPIHAPQASFPSYHKCLQDFCVQDGAFHRRMFRQGYARTATWPRATSVNHGARRLVCVSSFFVLVSHLSTCTHLMLKSLGPRPSRRRQCQHRFIRCGWTSRPSVFRATSRGVSVPSRPTPYCMFPELQAAHHRGCCAVLERVRRQARTSMPWPWCQEALEPRSPNASSSASGRNSRPCSSAVSSKRF